MEPPVRRYGFAFSPLAYKILRRACEHFSLEEERHVSNTEFLERLLVEWAELHMPEQLVTIKNELSN